MRYLYFDKADKWQKDLFCQIGQGNEDVEKLTVRAFALAKVEYLGENSKLALSPTRSLVFGNNFTIAYGEKWLWKIVVYPTQITHKQQTHAKTP